MHHQSLTGRSFYLAVLALACALCGCGEEEGNGAVIAVDTNSGADANTQQTDSSSGADANTQQDTQAPQDTHEDDIQDTSTTPDATTENDIQDTIEDDTQDATTENDIQDTTTENDIQDTEDDTTDTTEDDTQDAVDPPSCQSGTECNSGVCHPFLGTCMAPSCSDNVKNGDESDEDCGGSCPGCPLGAICFQDDDCALNTLCLEAQTVCVENICGDGFVDGPESCDDQNTQGADGCSDACAVEPGWSCDGEPSTCIPEASLCGDGLISGFEECDDGNQIPNDYCSNTCIAATCADFQRNGTESDSDCGGLDCPGCAPYRTCFSPSDCASGVCHPFYALCVEPGPCGDAQIHAGEQCDDGNFNDGDGCDSSCQFE